MTEVWVCVSGPSYIAFRESNQVLPWVKSMYPDAQISTAVNSNILKRFVVERPELDDVVIDFRLCPIQ